MFPVGREGTRFVDFCIIVADVSGLAFVKVPMKLNVVGNFVEK